MGCAGLLVFLSRADFEALVSHIPDADISDFVQWGFWTGMRKGEIAKLTWEAFDRETWTLRLPARSAKTKKPRKLAFSGHLRDIMERRIKARRLDTTPDFPQSMQRQARTPRWGLQQAVGERVQGGWARARAQDWRLDFP